MLAYSFLLEKELAWHLAEEGPGKTYNAWQAAAACLSLHLLSNFFLQPRENDLKYSAVLLVDWILI